MRRALSLGLIVACSPGVNVVPVVAKPVAPSLGNVEVIALPTGADMTPRAAPGSRVLELDPHVPGHPELRLGYAVSLALSPDGKTLALLTSGYNQLEDEKGNALPEFHAENVFFYDVSSGAPVAKEIVPLPNTFVGLAFDATGSRLYVSGGPDDSVHVLERVRNTWADVRTVSLGHHTGLGVGQGALAAGIAVSPDGSRVVVANHENDSVTVLDERTNTTFEISLRPGGGVAGGEYPFGVVAMNDRAYVTAQRDRELVEVDLSARKVLRRIVVGGQPVRVIASRDGSKLFVTDANTDDVAVIDRATFTVSRRIAVGAPPGTVAARLRGASPNSLVLSADERTLYVTLGGANAIAVVTLDSDKSAVRGLVPTAFYPNDVVVGADGKTLYCAFGKSTAGPNPKGPWFDAARVREKPYVAFGGNQFVLQMMRGGLHAFPIPDAPMLGALTKRALDNEHTEAPATVPPIFATLRGKVRRVVYVVSENRTFDQVLGDMPGVDGEPALVHWGAAITPNQHALATRFSVFDRFFDSGGVSGDGWQWSTAGRATDVAEKEVPLMYAGRGKHSYDWEGKNRGVNVAQPTLAERKATEPRTPDDEDLLPGVADVAAVDRPREGGRGYLWDAAFAAGLRVRNYGFFIDDARQTTDVREPFKTGEHVSIATALGLADATDPYFRGFDMMHADFWRAREWQRELRDFETRADMPELVLVRLPHDHLGHFARALDGVNTPDTQMADHDYALGLLVDSLSRSKFWKDTIVLALEDDAQNGADHVDAHRSFLFVAGGYAARSVVTHKPFTTMSVLRTIELLLGLQPLSRRDAVAEPITEALTGTLDETPFDAVVPNVLRSTKLPLPPPQSTTEHAALPRGDAQRWARATVGMNFDREDELDSAAFNAALYCGLVSPSSSACKKAP